MQNGQNLPRHFDVILGHVDRFETDQKALTPAPAGTAAPTGPATALASPGTSQTELIRVFYAVLYPDFTHTGQILANCRDEPHMNVLVLGILTAAYLIQPYFVNQYKLHLLLLLNYF